MKKLMSLVLSLSAAVLMTSCGGGDDGPATTAPGTSTPDATVGSSAQLSSFAGTYIGCFSSGTTSSEKETLVFNQQSADTFSFAGTNANYAAAGCAGAVTGTKSSSGTFTFTGTKTIGAETVNKIIVTEAGKAPFKQVALLKGGTQKGTPAYFEKNAAITVSTNDMSLLKDGLEVEYVVVGGSPKRPKLGGLKATLGTPLKSDEFFAAEEAKDPKKK